MSPKPKANVSRRHFLLAAGAGGAASVAAIAGKRPLVSASSGTSRRATRGYRATEHIESYYRTTKL